MGDAIWKRVKEILDAGKVPLVTVSEPDESIIALNRQGPGRPRIDGRFNWQHYKGTLLPGKRPVCKAKGCQRWLRKDQKAWCSQDCEDKGLADLSTLLSLLEPKQLEDLIRDNVDMDYRITKVNRDVTIKKKPRLSRRYGFPVYKG